MLDQFSIDIQEGFIGRLWIYKGSLGLEDSYGLYLQFKLLIYFGCFTLCTLFRRLVDFGSISFNYCQVKNDTFLILSDKLCFYKLNLKLF